MPPSPPYPPNTLKVPLTKEERIRIVAYFRGLKYSDDVIWQHINPFEATIFDPSGSFPGNVLGSTGLIAQWITTGGLPADAKALDAYNAVASGGGLGSGAGATDTKVNIPGLNTIKDAGEAAVKIVEALLNPNTWVRVGEFTVGAVLLAVGIGAMVKAGTK